MLKFCTLFNTNHLKILQEGMEVLNWWVDACREWCYNRFEDGKFGDQKYLDDWHNRFSTVHVLKHLGGGVAPWNVQQYTFRSMFGNVTGKELATGSGFDLVFYHYHGFHYTLNNAYSLSNERYILSINVVKHIYKPYVQALCKAKKTINLIQADTISHEVTDDFRCIKKVLGRSVLFFLRGYYKNFYRQPTSYYGLFN